MLLAVEDAANTGRGGAVRTAWQAVEARMADAGFRLRDPVTARIVRMPIMGASSYDGGTHALHVSQRAAASRMLEGLLSHEFSHMVLTERRHPSHDFSLLTRIAREVGGVTGLRGLEPVLVEVQKHAQDIYADDIAIRVVVRELAVPFFTGWVEGNLRRVTSDRRSNVLVWATNAFAIANLERHGLSDGASDIHRVATEFERLAGLGDGAKMVAAYRDLPRTEDGRTVSAALTSLCMIAAEELTVRRPP